MTTMELLATIALFVFLAWGTTDITYKVMLIRRMHTEEGFIRRYIRSQGGRPANLSDIWDEGEHR